jgi:hypothetical protein
VDTGAGRVIASAGSIKLSKGRTMQSYHSPPVDKWTWPQLVEVESMCYELLHDPSSGLSKAEMRRTSSLLGQVHGEMKIRQMSLGDFNPAA